MGECFGSQVDASTWSAILGAVPPDLVQGIWCAVIREIGREAARQRRLDDLENSADELIQEWLYDSFPANADLAWVLGEFDYFRELGLGWDEAVWFKGDACGSASDVAWDLRNRLEGLPDAQEAVTEDSVEMFYQEWRTRFLRRVLREASELDR